jgi:very-short-patch-repair endonuclease
MTRRDLPSLLLSGEPFLVGTAANLGVPYEVLRGGRFRQVCREVYVAADAVDTQRLRLSAVQLVVPASAVVTGRSAAWLLGVDIALLDDLIEVTLPRGMTLRGRGVLRPLQAEITAEDIVVRRGVQVTSPLRTAFDLARRPDRVEAVVAIDALWHTGKISPERLLEYAARHPGWRGVRRIQGILELADRKPDSPMESRLRMLLKLEAGLPMPETQIRVVRADGSTAARIDMGYRDRTLGVEYDGQIHGEARVRVRDHRRHNELQGLDWLTLRCTGDDYYHRPEVIIREVTEEFHKRAPNLRRS